MRGDIGQRFIFHDSSARDILALCFLFAPRGHCLKTAKHFRLARLNLNPRPCVFGVIAIIGSVGNPLHLIIQPRAAASHLKLFQHHRKDHRQMRYVGDGIVNLALVKRTPRPIGKARAFVQLDTHPQIDQVRIPYLFTLTKRHGRNLRIEHGMRGLASKVKEYFDILPASVKNL